MSYYALLGLDKEPFSTSPDPDFFFNSKEHKAAFCRLQIAITLKRGLSVLLGDVGAGKTTLSRKLSQALLDESHVNFRMILNPYFESDKQFLSRLAMLFHIEIQPGASALDMIEAVEKFLFKSAVEEGKTVVLLIDEAQILPDFVFEILRILLNYETNDYKMLQLVLVGQLELLPRISKMNNFWDRIAMKYVINPLGEDEVRELIEFRLRQAGYKGEVSLFTAPAIAKIWQKTQGFPRKISLLCHNSLEHLVMFDKRMVDADVVQQVIDSDIKQLTDEVPIEDLIVQ